MRYYHCVTFFNELSLLKLLAEEIFPLDPIIVLVEATHTHTGDEKPLYFEQNKHLFAKYNIRHIVVEDMPNTGNAWDNENYQRDCIMRGLTDCKEDDVIGIFDLDEIPRATSVAQYKPEMGVVGVKMDKFSYYLNCVEGWQQWQVGRLCAMQHLRKNTPNEIRNMGFDTVMCEGGWHFSFQGGFDAIVTKLFAYAHTESLTSGLMNNLKKKLETGQSLWAQDYWQFVKIDERFPKYLQDNQQEFEPLIKKIP